MNEQLDICKFCDEEIDECGNCEVMICGCNREQHECEENDDE